MGDFGRARDAKEFLVARIVDQAARERAPLSEVERGMLRFSEMEATSECVEINDPFDRQYNQEECEEKIARLIRNARARDRVENSPNSALWSQAARTLAGEDHYLRDAREGRSFDQTAL